MVTRWRGKKKKKNEAFALKCSCDNKLHDVSGWDEYEVVKGLEMIGGQSGSWKEGGGGGGR